MRESKMTLDEEKNNALAEQSCSLRVLINAQEQSRSFIRALDSPLKVVPVAIT